MARVHLLDDELINKIAAGEVVERPASVVKELVENAIDAGASQVRVSLKDGGRQLIQVTDDGLGMDSEDAILAIRRHTTSKLQKADDLFSVQTMGFRGEALASISSVSRFTLQTQTRGVEEGLRVTVEEGQLQSVAWSGSVGTSITVADLFYNVPARKSFLKTGAAEFAACHEYMQALALSLPQIGFTLLHNDREVFHVLPVAVGDDGWRGERALRKRVEDLFGEDVARPLIYLAKTDRYAKIEALMSAPGQDKASSKFVFTFVNQRWVRDKLIRYGIIRGYHSHLLKGKFPIAFLHVDVDAALVDVNVHPAKAELRFQYGNEVQNAIATAIREGLRKGAWAEAPKLAPEPQVTLARAVREAPSPIPTPTPEPLLRPSSPAIPKDFDLMLSSPQQERPLPPPVSPSVSTPKLAPFVPPTLHTRPMEATSLGAPKHSSPAPLSSPKPVTAPDTRIRETVMSFGAPTSPVQEAPIKDLIAPAPAVSSPRSLLPDSPSTSSESIPWDELQFMGAFGKCYLFFEHKERMLVVDQHAFHERVLYERLLQNPNLLKSSQPLLMPEVLAFRPSEIVELGQKQEHYKGLGLQYSILNDTEVEIQAVPSLLMNRDLGTVVQALLDGAQRSEELLHDHLATIACHAAVRAGEELPERELRSLMREANTVDFYHNCPHGRRVFRWWKSSQIAAWFDRLG